MTIGAEDVQRNLDAVRERSRADLELLVNTAARIAAGWAASGRNLGVTDAVAEAQNLIAEAEKLLGSK